MFNNILKVFKPPYTLHDLPALLGVFLLFLIIPVVTLNIGRVEQKPLKAASIPCPSLGNYGDVNGQNGVEATDAQLILQYAVGSKTFTQEQKRNADVNDDGKIDAVDSLIILQYISGSVLHYTFKACVDGDVDGFSNEIEKYVGTGHVNTCGTNAWPADINDDQVVNVQDILKYSGNIGKPVTTQALKRLDLNKDGIITKEGDIDTELMRFLNKSCIILQYPQSVTNPPTLTGNNSTNPVVNVGGSLTLKWTAGGYSGPCEGEDDWSGVVVNRLGSYTYNNLQASDNGKKYTIACSNYMSGAKASITLTVK